MIEVIGNESPGGESSAYAETRIVPTISLSQRYDTNVFLSPPGFVPPGTKLWDYVTTVAPLIDVVNKNRHADTSLRVGLTGNAFVNNPELNFVSTNLLLNSKLDGLVGRVLPGLKLRVVDSFVYTPEPPSFLTGVKPQGLDPFAIGLVASRANTYVNSATAIAEYPLSRRASLQGDYTYSIFRVGQIFTLEQAVSPVTFFDTNLHILSAGPSYKMTRSDTVSLKYQTTRADFSGGGADISFTAQGAAAEYRKETQSWTATMRGGATAIDPGNVVFLSGGADLRIKYDPSTIMRLSVSRAAGPAFFGTGGALISTNAGLSIEQRLSKALTFVGNVNYGHNEAAPVKILTAVSYAASGELRYRLTRTLSTSLSYNYTHFSVDLPNEPGPLSQYELVRQAVTFSITAWWPN